MFAGGMLGLGAVAGVRLMGPAIPVHVRGAVLGALMGVLLAPVLALFSFLSTVFLPFSIEGILGDSVWVRVARAINHRSFAPLFLPFIALVGLPMAACGYGGSRFTAIDEALFIPAGIGAMVLGAFLGAMFGSLTGKVRQPV
jgi:hypothetical protein